MSGLARHFRGEVHAIGSWGNALICVWAGCPTRSAREDVKRAALALHDQFPSGIGLVGVTAAEVPLVGAAERQEAEQLIGHGARLLGMASVIEGSARSVMSAIHLVAKQPCPMRIFATVDEAVSWMAPLLGRVDGQQVTSHGLRRAIEGLRHDLSAQTAVH